MGHGGTHCDYADHGTEQHPADHLELLVGVALEGPFCSDPGTPAAPFVAQKSQDRTGITLPNMEFFPAIDLLDFQTKYRVNASHSVERQVEALQQAMIKTNAELLSDAAMASGVSWTCQQVRAGYYSLDAVPAIQYGGLSEKVELYLAAVYAKAKQVLVERYRDTDTTRSGHQTAGFDKDKAVSDLIADYEQESREKLRLLMGKPRCTIELI